MLSRLQWLKLKGEERIKVAQMLGIPRSSHTIVENQSIVSDGHTDKDLEYITIEILQLFTKSTETDFYKLYDLTLNKILNQEITNVYAEEKKSQQDEKGTVTGKPKAPRGRPKKNKS